VKEANKMIQSYVALDLETTGLKAKTEKIIEIGAIKVIDNKIVDSINYLVNPKRPILERTTEITGITNDMVADAPYIEDIVTEIFEFIGDLPLLGHKISFDYSFLKVLAVNNGFEFEKMGIDTLCIARALLPKDISRKLSSICAYYDIETKSHRALNDAIAAHEIYQKMCSEYEDADCLDEMKKLVYVAKKATPATKRQIEYLKKLADYHKIDIDSFPKDLSRSEASRLQDSIIAQYGKYEGSL